MFKEIALELPSILLPKEGTDMYKWAVVACDQYTSQPEYWKDVESIVGDRESTLHMVFPEVYLEEGNEAERIECINKIMDKYLSEGTLLQLSPGFILVDRKTTHADSRKGLMVALDLDRYDYTPGSQTLVRATEGTVIERLPPRIRIRQQAPVELPHIMVLIDDPGRTVIEPIAEAANKLEVVYDFDLMKDGEHIKGYKVDSPEMIDNMLNGLKRLAEPESFRKKYNVGVDKDVLLYAVGDGNHSLAAAKGHWENIKKCLTVEEAENHPARFALVELVNVHDEGLVFEPIHRVVFNISAQDLLNEMIKYFGGDLAAYKLQFNSKAEMDKEVEKLKSAGGMHVLPFVARELFGVFVIKQPSLNLEVGSLQAFLDDYALKKGELKIDYIHGEDVVTELGTTPGNIGFFLPAMDKNDLFKTVIVDGVLPRKTFSMGEAEEKRFYLECRRIK